MQNREKFVLTFPLIFGIDGKPMSKSSGNCVWLIDSPDQMFGKIMSIPDALIWDYFTLLTNLSSGEIEKNKKLNPREAKARLAKEIVAMYHSKKSALGAEREFNKVFREQELPSKIPTIKIFGGTLSILDLLTKTKLASSKSEAKRLILQKGVKIDGEFQNDWKKTIEIKKDMVIQIGKRKFMKIAN